VTGGHIVAIGGNGVGTGSATLNGYLVTLVDAPRPRVCFIPTASADSADYTLAFFREFSALGCDPHVLNLFGRDVDDVRSFLLAMDLIYVGGGNTANMLAVWRVHGVDAILAEAHRRGVVLCGVSAGANCWFDASTTDSFLIGKADPLLDGLGLLTGSFCPHYTSEPERRPRFIELVGSGELPSGIACEDGAAVHFADGDLVAAVAAEPGARAHRVVPGDGGAAEIPLEMTQLR
jgi:dipeptidase E